MLPIDAHHFSLRYNPDMDMGRVHPWIGLIWVRLGQICKLQLNFIMCCRKKVCFVVMKKDTDDIIDQLGTLRLFVHVILILSVVVRL